MSTVFYPIYLRLNELSDERLCIGLLAFGLNNLFFDYDELKLKKAKAFMPITSIEHLNHKLKAFKSDIAASPKAALFESAPITIGYADYLNKTTHGLLDVGEGLKSAAVLDAAVYRRYFRDWVGTDKIDKPQSKKPGISSFLEKPGFEKIDKHLEVKPDWVNNYILKPHRVDFAAKNGAALVGSLIDLTNDENSIEIKLNTFNRMVKGFKSIGNEVFEKGSYRVYYFGNGSVDAANLASWITNYPDKEFEVYSSDRVNELSHQLISTAYAPLSVFLEE